MRARPQLGWSRLSESLVPRIEDARAQIKWVSELQPAALSIENGLTDGAFCPPHNKPIERVCARPSCRLLGQASRRFPGSRSVPARLPGRARRSSACYTDDVWGCPE